LRSPYLAGATISGKYRLIRLLGQGSAGSVWWAENLLVGRRVAIKILNESVTRIAGMQERFHAEARLSAKLAHPNVVDVYDLGNTEEGVPYIVMEVLDGDTLETVIERRGRIPLGEACDLMIQVLGTLAAAHDLEIVHRDLKPANVMLTYPKAGRAVVKVLDFGIAQGIQGEGATLSEAGMIIGTPQYMAPEQAMGVAIDHRVDLYAAGAILYEMLSGVPAISGDSLEVLLVRAMTVTPDPLGSVARGIPPRIEALVMSALAKDPEQRPRSANAMIDAIAPFADDSGSLMPRRTERPMALVKKRAAPEPAPPEPVPAPKNKPQKLALVLVDSTAPPPDEDWD
jgi:eukaryotic-like serine/threonine-protein kinase